MEKITINAIELASELAHQDLVNNWEQSIQIYNDETDCITTYTEEAQNIFNELYDKYLTLIESTQTA